MGEGEVFHRLNVLRLDGVGAAPGGVGTGCAQPDQIGAQAIDASGVAALGDLVQCSIVQRNRGKALPGIDTALLQRLLCALPLNEEGLRIGIEGQPTANDLGALAGRRGAVQLHLEAEAIQQLRA